MTGMLSAILLISWLLYSGRDAFLHLSRAPETVYPFHFRQFSGFLLKYQVFMSVFNHCAIFARFSNNPFNYMELEARPDVVGELMVRIPTVLGGCQLDGLTPRPSH